MVRTQGIRDNEDLSEEQLRLRHSRSENQSRTATASGFISFRSDMQPAIIPLTPRPDCNHSSDWNDCCCLHQDRHCQRNLRKQRNWRRWCLHYRDRLCLLLCSTIRFF